MTAQPARQSAMRLSRILGGPIDPDPDITGLTADSREAAPGMLFAALPGARVDGARFIPAAIAAGAAAVLASTSLAPEARAAVGGAALVLDDAPRRRLALMASAFYPARPTTIVGVTGTNGKTSTAHFTRLIWRAMGRGAGSLGTLGAVADGFHQDLQHTTPEPVTLHRTLSAMAAANVECLAMEASSHALAQARVDGVAFAGVGFTNITRDHLDYHATFEDYAAAKRRLFEDLAAPDGFAVVNMDGAGADDFAAAARARGLRLITVGRRGEDIRLETLTAAPRGLAMRLSTPNEGGREYAVEAPVVGAFQAENALVAAGFVIGAGAAPRDVLPLLAQLEAPPGRMQHVADVAGAAVYVDYAHTPDAVAAALRAARPHAEGRLTAIIGAGGDRDPDKRPLMGAAATAAADAVIVTDDNPRSENPGAIRRMVLAGAPDAVEIADRADAIRTAVTTLKAGDVLLIAGKGHETGQIVGDQVLPFDDAAVALSAVELRESKV